ncbi:MAG: flavin monoamine oxidase family protein [Chitinophagales bacterium]
MIPRSPKTPLLASLIKAFRKSLKAGKKNIALGEINSYYSDQRRDFLKKTSKAVAAISLLGPLENCRKVIEAITPYDIQGAAAVNAGTAAKIIIVGGGMAGLHAAFILKQKGYLAQVYEGSSRISGRIYSAQNILGNGLTTEMGGEFIDSTHKDMLKLAKTFKLDLIDTRSPAESYLQYQAHYFNGIQFTEEQVINEFSLYATQLKRDIQSLSDVITVDQHTANDVLFDNMSVAAYFDRIGLKGWLRQLLDVAYLTEYGQPTDKQTSLNFLFLMSATANNHFDIFGGSDERYKVSGGNQQICDHLAQQLEGQINLNFELLNIHQNNNNSYDVTFKTGNTTKVISCNILLLAIPFTILRNISVQPAWPGWKNYAITKIGYGNNSKLMLGFQQRYWRSLGYQGYYFTDSILQCGWDNSLLQPPVTGGLSIYSGGEQAITVGNGSVQSQVNQHLPLLNNMFPGATRNYNNKAERFIWPTYKWVKASYSCFSPGQYTTIAGNEMKPVGNIYFAGEHCSYNFQGYMNGAAETGRRAAENILQTLQNSATTKSILKNVQKH